ncbi:MAG TPA: hypothetical protein VKQ73_04175 [Stellaceae bacterium]|nr:hypothetical protein [Stellaceae bacterium]
MTSSTAERPAGRVGTAALCLLLPAIGYYALLLTAGGTSGLFQPLPTGLNFNSMLLHMLHGRFDVDPAAVGLEGFRRNGAVYSYFGIFPALLRAPLLVLPNFATTDFTRLSCLVADSLMALFKVMSVLVLWRSVDMPRRPLLLWLLIAAILASGPQVLFLRPSIYQEILLWADVFAAAFVLLVLQGWTRPDGFSIPLMSTLAAVAGLCLLTRVSTALGLYVALGLIWLWRGWAVAKANGAGGVCSRLLSSCLPLLILLAFAVATGIVNQQRWGNPFVFMDMNRSLIETPNPAHVAALHEYGEFNPIRLPFGLLYYFFPLWALRDGSGQLLWSGFVERTMIDVELPPSSFLLSDPLLIGLGIYGAVHLARGRAMPRRAPIALAACGLLIPALLMLCAIAMTYRYRMEFYPLLELGAFIGFWCLLAVPGRGGNRLLASAALVDIFAAQFLWLIYMLSPFGMASDRLGQTDIFRYYGCLLHRCP